MITWKFQKLNSFFKYFQAYYHPITSSSIRHQLVQAHWLSCRVLDSRLRGPLVRTLTASLCSWARHINSSWVLVQPRKTRPYIPKRLLMGRKESHQQKTSTCHKANEQFDDLHRIKEHFIGWVCLFWITPNASSLCVPWCQQISFEETHRNYNFINKTSWKIV